MKQTISCLLQNRLGALDRVLGALTYRGYVPEYFACTQDPQSDRLECIVVLECNEEKNMEKLVKFLQKQVYVLQVQRFIQEKQLSPLEIPQTNVAPLYVSAQSQRRSHHV